MTKEIRLKIARKFRDLIRKGLTRKEAIRIVQFSPFFWHVSRASIYRYCRRFGIILDDKNR